MSDPDTVRCVITETSPSGPQLLRIYVGSGSGTMRLGNSGYGLTEAGRVGRAHRYAWRRMEHDNNAARHGARLVVSGHPGPPQLARRWARPTLPG